MTLCSTCWPASRYIPLPFDTSLSPIALVRTVAVWLFRPRTSREVYPAHGSAWRSLLFAASTVALCLCSAWALTGLDSAALWSGGAAPAPHQFLADLGDWTLRYFVHLLALQALLFATDRALLWGRTDSQRLLRAWAFTLAPLWTVWIAVVLIWTGTAITAFAGGVFAVPGLLLTLAGPLWLVVAFVNWLLWRWWLLPWASDSRAHARIAAVGSLPILAATAFAVGLALSPLF